MIIGEYVIVDELRPSLYKEEVEELEKLATELLELRGVPKHKEKYSLTEIDGILEEHGNMGNVMETIVSVVLNELKRKVKKEIKDTKKRIKEKEELE